MPNDIVKVDFADLEIKQISRAMAVQVRLKDIRLSVEERFFEMCELLTEAHDNDYHVMYGFGRFGEWVERGSGLDISSRTAFYYINIWKKAQTLQLDKEKLAEVGITKLKEIFSLDTSAHPDEIRGLVESASQSSVDDVKGRVSQVKTKNGQVPKEFMAMRIDSDVKKTIDKAFKLARLQYGDQVDEHGEVQEASHSKCMEIISLSYIQDPQNYPEGISESDL